MEKTLCGLTVSHAERRRKGDRAIKLWVLSHGGASGIQQYCIIKSQFCLFTHQLLSFT